MYKRQTVPEAGWSGKKNGELLALMTGNYDVFITVDQNLQYQLNLRNAAILILIITSPSNRYDDIKLMVPKILQKLSSSKSVGVLRI